MTSLRSKRFLRVCAKGLPYVRMSFPPFGCAKVGASKNNWKGRRRGGDEVMLVGCDWWILIRLVCLACRTMDVDR